MVSYAEIAAEFDVEPFRFPGFNGRILMIGDIDTFWQCTSCANATESKPRICGKCYGGSFEHIKPRRFRAQPLELR